MVVVTKSEEEHIMEEAIGGQIGLLDQTVNRTSSFSGRIWTSTIRSMKRPIWTTSRPEDRWNSTKYATGQAGWNSTKIVYWEILHGTDRRRSMEEILQMQKEANDLSPAMGNAYLD